ncbi:SMODS domain-containing nucleotidyltransferase [Micromonospora echinospora]
MTLTTYQAFEQFLADITITDYQKTSIVAGRKNRVVENLTSGFPKTSDLPFLEARLMGSAAKQTIVRPLDDIDVLAVFSNENNAWSKYRNDSQSFLYRVKRAYDGLEAAQVGARGQAIRVFFKAGGHVDVAPVFRQSTDVFHLPSGNGSWILTSPFIANKWFLDKNAELGYNLAPLVRMLKKWNSAHSKRLGSFHLETVAGHSFRTLGSNRRSGLQKFFEWAGNHLDVNDPGGQSGLLSGYLSLAAKDQVRRSLDVAAERATKAINAENSGDHEEAKRLWRIVLGSSFPA